MTKARQHWPILFLLLVAGVCALTGCESGGHFTLLGYTTQPPFDPDIRSVFVPIPQNVSLRKDLEFDLHTQVVRELGLRAGAPRVTSERARADSELLLKIINVRKSTLLVNQLGETRDSELSLQIEVIWRDLRPGHLGNILSNAKGYDPQLKPLPGDVVAPPPGAVPLLIMPASTFIPELGGSFAASERQALTRASWQIVNMMETWR